jgi:hypothetical protein
MRVSIVLALLAALSVTAQQRPIYDPDDFVDPRQHDRPVFISRLVLGAAKDLVNDYRPARRDAGVLHFANSFYWSRFQMDYKHTQEHPSGPPRLQACPCLPPVYFPTAPSNDDTPAAPPLGARDTLQFGWYRSGRSAMLRSRFTISQQRFETIVTALDTEKVVARLHGHDRSFGFESDTSLRIAGRDILGAINIARTIVSGTTPDRSRSQNELTYTNRFPVKAIGSVLIRPTLTIGAVTGRGANGPNVIHPAIEAFFHHTSSGGNVHFIYGPETIRSGTGWVTRHQMLLSIDHAIFVWPR